MDQSDMTAGVYTRTPTGGWPDPPAPSAEGITAATRLIAATETPTPFVLSRPLSQRYGRTVHLKLESLSPVRSFKHRGALASVNHIATTTEASEIITASTGNHGQGVALAGSRLGLDVTVLAPETALADKVAAMRDLGATVDIVGANLSEAQIAAEELADQRGAAYIEDGEDPYLMAGAATVAHEMLTQQPDLAAIVVPVGGGNLIGGTLLTAAACGSEAAIVGVQSTAAPSVTASWMAGRPLEMDCTTFAGGLATERPGLLALDTMLRQLSTSMLVTEDALFDAIRLTFHQTGLVIEGASAATIAALEAFGDDIPGDPVGVIISGSWLSGDQLATALGR